jgi:hypothetical protein
VLEPAEPLYTPISASSLLPNSIAPSAAKYCALSGVLMHDSAVSPSGISTPRSFHIFGMLVCQASRIPAMKVFGPPSSSTCGLSVLPRVSTVRFCSTIASKSDAISSSGGVPAFCRPLMSVSANTPHLPATLCSLMPL